MEQVTIGLKDTSVTVLKSSRMSLIKLERVLSNVKASKLSRLCNLLEEVPVPDSDHFYLRN
jgi:hypothetical protein